MQSDRNLSTPSVRKCLSYERCDLAAEQFDCAHHVPVLHAHPLNTCNEPIAAGSPHQIGNLGTAFFRGTDYEPICNKVLEFRMGLRIADNASEQAPITKNPVALGDGRPDIANGGFPIRRHHNITQDWEIAWSRLPLPVELCLEDPRLLSNDVILEMRRRHPSVTERRVGDFRRASHSILDACSEPQG